MRLKAFLPALLLMLCPSALAQRTFEITNASRFFDVKIVVESCTDTECTGKASYSFYKKGQISPYQVINVPDTYIDIEQGGKPAVNVTMLYDKQSAINVADYNFDGMEDVAICTNPQGGSYGMPAYSVYLSSKTARKFVYDRSFSALGRHLGMFELDAKRKRLVTFDKSGCCWHQTEEFEVVNNRPRKVKEITEDATNSRSSNVKVITKTLVNGRWRTRLTYEKRPED
jgi:hypothetical protein